jgi:cobalt/nickel transport system permease protein
MCAAIEFGIQPELFSKADGTPLYAPFHLSQTVPTMALAHLTVAGIAEFALTMGVVAFLQRANVPVLRINHPNVPLDGAGADRRPLGWRWALIGMAVLVMLTPLGLLAPGGAFGEDSPRDLDLGKYNLRAVPTGLARWSSFWDRTVLSGYGFDSGRHPSIGYMLSAVVGMAAITILVGVAYLLSRSLARLRRSAASASVSPSS